MNYWLVFDGVATITLTGRVRRIDRQGTVIDEHDLAKLGEQQIKIDDGQIIGDDWAKPGLRFSMDLIFPDVPGPNKNEVH